VAFNDYVIADIGEADFGRKESILPKPKCLA
jgi:hypothetical protein